MDLFQVIESRYSVRSYQGKDVDKDSISKILRVAAQAPTAANRQAFKIFVISTKGKEELLLRIYKKNWFIEAPYIILICKVLGESWVRWDGKDYGDVDCGIAMEHIILAATAEGLATCWIGAFNVEDAKKLLKLDENLEPIAFTPIGYEKEATIKRPHKEISELVTYI